MTRCRKQLGAGLAAAVAVGFGAYALGTQAGDGAATAAGDGERELRPTVAFAAHPGPAAGRVEPRLDGLADRLGVETSELREALADVRREHTRDDPPEELAAALAEALDLPEDEVAGALDEVHERHDSEMRDALAEALATELGLEQAAVSAALTEVGPPGPHGPGGPRAFVRELAEELGVSRRRLRNALEAARPERPPHHESGDRLMGPDGLADALGVSEDELESAMEQVHEQIEPRLRERHEEFVNGLAERLGIPAERVRDALPGPPLHGPPPGP